MGIPFPRLVPCLFTLASLLSLSAAAEHVLTLTAKNFEEEVLKHDFIVVEFYAPWCGHCKSLAPEYEKAAKALKEEGVPVTLAKMDADDKANKPLAERFGVKGFPTLKIFKNKSLETPQDYNGPREADGIVSYLKKQTGPASVELTSGADIKASLDAEGIVVVGVFPDLGAEEYAKFANVAEFFRSVFVFRHTSDASLLPVEHPKLEGSGPAVRVLTTFDETYYDTTDFEEDALKEFIAGRALPSVVEFSNKPKDRTFLERAFNQPTNKSILFFSYDISNADDFRKAYAEVAKTRPAGLTFIIGSVAENDQAMKYFGLAVEDTPLIVVHDSKTNSKYYRTKIEPSSIKDFIENFLAGKEEKKLKSEPVPEKNDELVKVVVGTTFDDLVLNSGKNVLIEFYAPWCGHCKKLEPVYKQVAKEFKDNPNVVIAKLDYTSNDLSTNKFSVEGFPTIYFYTKAGEVVQYKGDRSKKDLISFVKQQLEIASAAANASQAEEGEVLAEAAEAAAEAAAGAAEGKDEL